jgi:GT2 family glycosyltransferase
MDLSIIILNWNAGTDTIGCVQRIAAWQQVRPTIWVVDNGSTDGSAEAIVQECSHIRLIRNPVNLGFAGGNNRGLSEALAWGDAPILLINNDAWIAEEDVVQLLKTLQANLHIGFIGPLLYDAEQPDKLLAAGGMSPVKRHHSHLHKFNPDSPVFTVEYIPGTVIIGRAEVFRTVGLLDEDFFFSAEVADLCLRATRHGYPSAVETRARAYHSLNRSSNLRDTLYTYYIIRNRFVLLRNHYRWHIWLYSFWILYSLALALKLQLGGKTHTAQSVYLGLLDGLRGRFGGQNERVLAAVLHQPPVVGAIQQEANG